MSNFKLLFAVVFLFTIIRTPVAKAQVEQGKWLVGGALNYQSGDEFEFAGTEIDTQGAADLNVFAFAPRVGYALSDNFVVGGRLALAFGTEDQSTLKFRANGFAFAPFARYYVPLNDKAYFFGEALVNVGSLRTTLDGEEISSSSLFQIGITPGFAYFISDKVSVEFLLNLVSFASIKEKDADEADTVVNIGPNLDLNGPSLAIQFFF